MIIKNDKIFARFNILMSIFSKKIKRPVNILIFKTLTEKAMYDKLILTKGKSPIIQGDKKYKHIYNQKNIFDYDFSDYTIIKEAAIIESETKIKHKPAISLTYYIDKEK